MSSLIDTLDSYEEVINYFKNEERKINLLIGNGFSIAYDKDIFSYNALSKSPKSRTENPSRVNTFATLTKRSSNGNVKRVLRSCNVGVQVFSWQAQPEEVLPG